MSRHAAKHLSKPVRRLRDALARLGVLELSIETTRSSYLFSWLAGGVRMRIAMGLSSSSNAFESAWQGVRRLFRQHRLPVPA